MAVLVIWNALNFVDFLEARNVSFTRIFFLFFSPSLWATYASPNTLVSIGMEALALLHDHTIHFTDLKTQHKLYYTIDNPIVGLGAQNLAGHFSLPMFAYSETVIRPNIHIVRYPDMHKLFLLQSKYWKV